MHTIDLGTHLHPTFGGISSFIKLTSNSATEAFEIRFFNVNASRYSFYKVISFLDFIKYLYSLPPSPVHIRFHGLYAIFPLTIPFILPFVISNFKYSIYTHGMTYPSVICGSNSFLKKVWLFLFSIISSLFNFTFVSLSPQELSTARLLFPKCIHIIHSPKYFNRAVCENRPTNFFAKSNSQNIKFIMLCRYSPEKQIDRVIDCFANISDDSFELVIYGAQDFNPQYFSQCSKLASFDKRVILRPFASSKEIEQILSQFHYSIIFSTKENLSFALIESALHGTIPITNSAVGSASFLCPQNIFVASSPYAYDELLAIFKSISLTHSSEYYDKSLSLFNDALNAFTY